MKNKKNNYKIIDYVPGSLKIEKVIFTPSRVIVDFSVVLKDKEKEERKNGYFI